MAKFKATGLELEADLRAVEEIATKRLPEKINEWWTNRKNKKLVENAIKDIRILAFKPWKKHLRKFRVCENFALPKSREQYEARFDRNLKYIYGDEYVNEFKRRLAEDFAHFDLLEKFQEENGGQDNFGVYLKRTIKIQGFTMKPMRKVYTYSKKEKAVFVLEEFRPFDNSYNMLVFCTKNWGN